MNKSLLNRKPQPKGAEFFEQVITILREEDYPQWIELRKRLNGVFDEMERLQQVEKDYKALIHIMDRARNLAFIAEEENEEELQFKMDSEGNLHRVDTND